MKIQKRKQGITLISLIITIIILLILAGVSILSLMSENGLISNAKEAKQEVKLSEYEEKINLIIFNTVTDKQFQKSKTFCTILKEKLEEEKDWIKELEIDNEESRIEKSYIIITTKEGFEFTIEIENKNESAKITKINNDSTEKLMIKYNSNGGEGEEKIKYVRENFTINLDSNEFTKPYYTFVGWGVKQNENETIYSEGSRYKVTKNTTLYAQWSQQVVNIEFDSNNGLGNMVNQQVGLGSKTTIKTNEYYKDGYVFSGWNTKSNGTGTSYIDGDEILLTNNENIKLYAMWSKTITITYDANGGSSTPEPQAITVYNDETSAVFRLANEILRPYCYTFLGWSTSNDATEPMYMANNDYNFSEDKILYAVWAEYKEFTAAQLAILNEAYRDGEYIILPANSNAISYGPYYQVLKGSYTIHVYGNNFLSDMRILAYETKNSNYSIENIQYTSSEIVFNLTIDEDLNGFGLEIVIFPSPSKDVIIKGMKWVKNEFNNL